MIKKIVIGSWSFSGNLGKTNTKDSHEAITYSIENNIKIIIDAAAMSIDDIKPSKIIPQTVSLHATKLLNCAEGGLIISKDDYEYRLKDNNKF